MVRWFAGALVAASLSVAAAAHGAPSPPAGLEAALGYPFISNLTASGDGRRIAWVETRRGVRNLYTAEAVGLRPHRLTDGRADDGQELGGVAFSPDGRVLAWTRGGGEHNSWANDLAPPNPASAVDQPQLEVWASVAGAAPVKVAEGGESPAVSRDGRIAYVKEHQVWVASADGKAKPARLFYDRGKVDDLAWSPDGRRLAFVSHRGDHSFVGIFSGAGAPLLWLAPSTGIDSGPVWAPDGRRVAFTRQDGESDILNSPLVEKPEPFSIWIASADDGEGRAVWRSPRTLNGSFPQLPDGLFLTWAAGDRLVFRAEMDGWPHLYALAAAGGEPALLTPGDYMVEHVALAPDRRTLVFDANGGTGEGATDRRHLYRVSVDHPGVTALTSGEGLEWTAAPLQDGGLAYIGSRPDAPMRVAVLEKDGRSAHPLDPAPDPYATAVHLVTPRPVTFRAADGLLVHGQIFAAPGGAARKPGLIFVHGGPPRQMLLGWSYMDYYAHAYAMNQFLAAHGYVVLSVNYRLGIGYGRAFQHPAKAGAAGNSEYQDVVAGARLLQAQAGVDPARIGIWGGSYGGLLTAQALARDSDLFKAGVDFHGVHDWSLYPGRSGRPPRFEQGDYEAAMKSAFESSPESAIAGWRSPVLLIHGDDDRNVRFDQTVDLARRLSVQGTPFEELIIPNEIHGFLRYDSWLRADVAAVRFLDSKLHPSG